MRKLLMTTAVAVALATPAVAQEQNFMTGIQSGDFYGSELIGKRLYVSEAEVETDGMFDAQARAEWDDVGEINDILISQDGEVKAVLLDIGGFLGIGEKRVAVNMDELKFVREGEDADDYFIVVQGSAAMLDEAPAFDRTMMMSDSGMPAADMEPRAETEAQVITEEPEATAEMEAEAEIETDTTAEMETEVETELEEAGNELAEVGNDIEQAVEEGANEVAEATDEVIREGEEEMAEAEADVEIITNDAEADVEVITEGAETEVAEAEAELENEVSENPLWTAPNIERDGFAPVARTELTAEMLEGARIYGAGEENVGEISDLILTEDGTVEKAIVDVGGFLGIGEHRIAVDFEELQVIRDQNGGGVQVHISATQEQLEQRETYVAR
jgi:hypothetical protein